MTAPEQLDKWALLPDLAVELGDLAAQMGLEITSYVELIKATRAELGRVDHLLTIIDVVLDIHSPMYPPPRMKWITGGRAAHCKGCDNGDPYDATPWPCETARALQPPNVSVVANGDIAVVRVTDTGAKTDA